MSEFDATLALARRILDRDADPDDDMAMLSRQLLRAVETVGRLEGNARGTLRHLGEDGDGATDPVCALCVMATALKVWADDRLIALHGGVGAEPGVMAGNLEFFAQLIDEAGVQLGGPIIGPGVVQETLRRYAKTIREAEGRRGRPDGVPLGTPGGKRGEGKGMASFTAGPWFLDGDDTARVVSNTGQSIADCNRRTTTEEDEANARICAAAPDLLAACQAAVDLLSRVPAIPNREGWATSVVVKCQDAIRKATGRAP